MTAEAHRQFEIAQVPPGEYGVVTEPGTIRLQRVLPGPIERVWSFLTESGKRGRWLAAGRMELREGGQADFMFHHADLSSEKTVPKKYRKYKGGMRMLGRVLRSNPPRLLTFSWGEETGRESEVTFELTSRNGEVLLVLTHRRLKDRTEMVSAASGWYSHLGILSDRLHDLKPRPFWSTVTRMEGDYESRIASDARGHDGS